MLQTALAQPHRCVRIVGSPVPAGWGAVKGRAKGPTLHPARAVACPLGRCLPHVHQTRRGHNPADAWRTLLRVPPLTGPRVCPTLPWEQSGWSPGCWPELYTTWAARVRGAGGVADSTIRSFRLFVGLVFCWGKRCCSDNEARSVHCAWDFQDVVCCGLYGRARTKGYQLKIGQAAGPLGSR